MGRVGRDGSDATVHLIPLLSTPNREGCYKPPQRPKDCLYQNFMRQLDLPLPDEVLNVHQVIDYSSCNELCTKQLMLQSNRCSSCATTHLRPEANLALENIPDVPIDPLSQSQLFSLLRKCSSLHPGTLTIKPEIKVAADAASIRVDQVLQMNRIMESWFEQVTESSIDILIYRSRGFRISPYQP